MLTWLEKIPTFQINPETARREDVVRLAEELMEARHELKRLSSIVGELDAEIIEFILADRD